MENDRYKQFGRKFFDSEERITYIGSGSIGGKAKGLLLIDELLNSKEFDNDHFTDIEVNVPVLTILRTDIFDEFMEMNDLYRVAYSGLPDDRISHAFQQADLPFEILGDLRALISEVHTPLAIRSSSMLEDAMFEPFAGIYGTKMIPNNQFDIDTRFHKLTEAIKFVYSSTYFRSAKEYIKATKHTIRDEKMAVIIQEVVGNKQMDRYYPEISGVAKSYNFYPSGSAKPEDGVVNLALGLGKTIVDGGNSWFYSPEYPKVGPPFGSINDMLKGTQLKFWSVNMGKPPKYDPINEVEYLNYADLSIAEIDGTIKFLVSTVDSSSGRLNIGMGTKGPRILTFAPLLSYDRIQLNELIQHLLELCENKLAGPVEIEFAVTLTNRSNIPQKHNFGFLQVRPMVVSEESIELEKKEFKNDNVLVASENVIGNGILDHITDIVFIKKDTFDIENTKTMANEIGQINETLLNEKRQYLLLGFGRWGTSDEWAGIPVNWGQVSGVRVIVETMLEKMNFDLSQGSHFFHNLTSFNVYYFSNPYNYEYDIDWEWLNSQPIIKDTTYARHIRTKEPVIIKADALNGRGIILKSREKNE
jgi:hypothetical protein